MSLCLKPRYLLPLRDGVEEVTVCVQFTAHAGPRALLLATATEGPAGAPLELVEASPHDFFWGRGVDGSGANHLGTLLMSIRDELLATQCVQHDRHSAEHLSTAEDRKHTRSL